MKQASLDHHENKYNQYDDLFINSILYDSLSVEEIHLLHSNINKLIL